MLLVHHCMQMRSGFSFSRSSRLDSADAETLWEEALEMLQLRLPYFNVALFANALILKDNFKKMRVCEAKGKKKKTAFGKSAFLESCNIFDVFFFVFF